jgi:hypothetical protein
VNVDPHPNALPWSFVGFILDHGVWHFGVRVIGLIVFLVCVVVVV